MKASFVNPSHRCPQTVGTYPIMTPLKRFQQNYDSLIMCLFITDKVSQKSTSETNRYMFTHMHVHAKTHSYLIRETGPPCPPLSELCSGLEGDSDKHFLKNFLPLPALFFSILPSPTSLHPSPGPSLLVPSSSYPPACTPFCSFRRGPEHPTPHWSLFFH